MRAGIDLILKIMHFLICILIRGILPVVVQFVFHNASDNRKILVYGRMQLV